MDAIFKSMIQRVMPQKEKVTLAVLRPDQRYEMRYLERDPHLPHVLRDDEEHMAWVGHSDHPTTWTEYSYPHVTDWREAFDHDLIPELYDRDSPKALKRPRSGALALKGQGILVSPDISALQMSVALAEQTAMVEEQASDLREQAKQQTDTRRAAELRKEADTVERSVNQYAFFDWMIDAIEDESTQEALIEEEIQRDKEEKQHAHATILAIAIAVGIAIVGVMLAPYILEQVSGISGGFNLSSFSGGLF